MEKKGTAGSNGRFGPFDTDGNSMAGGNGASSTFSSSHPPEDWEKERKNLLSVLALKANLAVDVLDSAYLSGLEANRPAALQEAVEIVERNNAVEREWEVRFRKEDFFRIMEDAAPITDLIAYMRNIERAATERAVAVAEECMHEEPDLRASLALLDLIARLRNESAS